MRNKYSEFVSRLLTGEHIRISIESSDSREKIRTSISREKTRQEESLRAFELPVENTRIHWKKINGSELVWEVSLKSNAPTFEILSEIPPLTEEDEPNS